MDLIESLKKILDEAVGVPQNLIQVSQKTYNDIINYLSQKYDKTELIENISDINIHIPGPIQIANMTYENIVVKIDFREYHKYEIQRMYYSSKTEINFPNVISHPSDKLKIGITLMYPDNGTMEGIIDFFKNERPKVLSSIAHELKHAYDFYMKGTHPIERYVEYNASQEVSSLFDISYLNNYIFSFYFFHGFENSVRPSEMLSYLLEMGTTKETFLENLKTSRIFKEIKFSTELTYEKLVQSIEDSHSIVYNILKSTFDNPPKDKSKIAQVFLFTLRRVIINAKLKLMDKSIPERNLLEIILGRQSYYNKFMDKFYNKLTSGGKFYEKDYDETRSPELNKVFYEKNINNIKRLANNTLKKVSKVYSELPSEKDNIMTLNKKISSKK